MIDSMGLLLSLVFLLMGLKLIVLFFLSYGKRKKNIPLFFLELVLFIEVFESYLIIKGDIVDYPYLFLSPNALHCLIGILPFLFIKQLKETKVSLKSLAPLLWPLVMGALYLPILFDDPILLLDEYYLGSFNRLNLILETLGFIIAIYYTYKAIGIAHGYWQEGYHHFSSYQFQKLKLFKTLLYVMIAFYFVSLILPFMGLTNFYPMDYNFSLSLTFFLLSFVTFVVAISRLPDFIVPRSEGEEIDSLKQKTIKTENNKVSKNDFVESDPEARKFEEYVPKLTNYITKKKPYLNPNLKISDLANESKIPQYIITHVLNNHLEKNFFEYVNDLRIEEFTTQLEEPENKNKTIMELAIESGFNSKSSFNSHFKKKLDMTPNQYRKNLKL